MTKTLNFNLNQFLKTISVKKQYLQSLRKKLIVLNNLKQKNYKLVNYEFFKEKSADLINDNVITYIINITFSRSNTFLHLMDSSGRLRYYCSAGNLKFKGKQKSARLEVLKGIYSVLATKIKFLKGKPVALHLNNVGSQHSRIVRKLKKKFYIKIVKIFNVFPFNGCRKKKVRRVKKNKDREKKKWLSGLRRQTVNLLSFLIEGSNPSFFKTQLLRF